MHFIVKVFSEIIIKSPPVRKRFIKQLRDNLRVQLNKLDVKIDVQRDFEKIEIRCDDESVTRLVADVLSRTPGIANYALIHDYPLCSMHEIYELTLKHWGEALEGKSFCVRAKRVGKHDFTSVELEQYVGGGLRQNTKARGVNLHNPDIIVPLEIKDERVWIITEKKNGLGGFPLGTQEAVLSLISGGFDSTVSTYLMMKRGVRAHFCFFNLGGRAHELGVKEVAYYLWNKYGSSHRVKFVTVPFEGVVNEILEKVDNSYMGVTLKRMMLRAAEQVAKSLDVPALMTGEAIAQVSSQTLINLNVIDQATPMLVLRPLATMDKLDIINISRKIGTEAFAAAMPEYCGVISVNPTTRAKMGRVIAEEENFDFAVLQDAIDSRRAQNIDEIIKDLDVNLAVPHVAEVPAGAVIVDIRHPDEEETAPLKLENAKVIKIPFYQLTKKFPELDQSQTYYLYCQKGVMSQLHAETLREEGAENLGVYRPEPVSACSIE